MPIVEGLVESRRLATGATAPGIRELRSTEYAARRTHTSDSPGGDLWVCELSARQNVDLIGRTKGKRHNGAWRSWPHILHRFEVARCLRGMPQSTMRRESLLDRPKSSVVNGMAKLLFAAEVTLCRLNRSLLAIPRGVCLSRSKRIVQETSLAQSYLLSC
jgi:hypothetical protein